MMTTTVMKMMMMIESIAGGEVPVHRRPMMTWTRRVMVIESIAFFRVWDLPEQSRLILGDL
jgi:hypothetical protein